MTTETTGFSYSHTVGSLSNNGRGMQNPVDMALDSRGVMYVINRAGPELALRLSYKRVTMCTVEQEFLGEFGAGGTGPGEFWWPSSVAFDSRDRLYVADEALNRAQGWNYSRHDDFLTVMYQAADLSGDARLRNLRRVANELHGFFYTRKMLLRPDVILEGLDEIETMLSILQPLTEPDSAVAGR